MKNRFPLRFLRLLVAGLCVLALATPPDGQGQHPPILRTSVPLHDLTIP